jgi:phytoene desaturase
VPAIYAMIHFVEKTWGIHYVMGGTGALVAGHREEVRRARRRAPAQRRRPRIDVTEPNPGGRPGSAARARARRDAGRRAPLEADIVVSNADYAHTYLKLIEPRYRFWNSDLRVGSMRYSMSLVVIYFGFKDPTSPLRPAHHNIILGPRYEGLLTDIFENLIIPEDFSAVPAHPHAHRPEHGAGGAPRRLHPHPRRPQRQRGGLGGRSARRFVDVVLRFLETAATSRTSWSRIVTKAFVTPDYFEHDMSSWLGNAFGVEPRLTQTAFFRPHNRSEDVEGLYLVGASAQPGAGTPSVMMSAKMTAREIAEDFASPLRPAEVGEELPGGVMVG